MDILNNLALGFAAAFTLQNLAYCFIGTLLITSDMIKWSGGPERLP